MAKIVGIDLGTTNSCAAHVVSNIPRIVPIEAGFNTMPSAVTYHPNGQVYVGQAAKELGVTLPYATIQEVKRLVGRPFTDKTIRTLSRRVHYTVVADVNGEAAVRVGNVTHQAIDVQAAVLSQMKRYVEINLGDDVPDAVIAVPAYFSEHQRLLVREAAKRAGWNVHRLINEPTAAALAYGFNRGLDQRVLVYDLGGGTFDVSILHVRGNTFEVLATGGDVFLGGADFDDRILGWILRYMRKQAKIDDISEPVIVQQLRAAAERAKIELSILANTQVRLPDVFERRGKAIDVELILDRETLNALTRDLVQRTIRVVDLLLERRSIDKQSIDEIILVGGQTRMPLVIDAITEHFAKSPRKGVSPDESVALGAALVGNSDTVTLVDTVTGPFDPEILEDVPSEPPGLTTQTTPEPHDREPRSGLRDLVRNVFGRHSRN